MIQVLLVTLLAAAASNANPLCQDPLLEPKNVPSYADQKSVACEIKKGLDSYVCPEHCSCVFRPSDKANIINCQGAGLRDLPQSLPRFPQATHTELNLQNNQLENFNITGRAGYEAVTRYNLATNKISSFNTEGISENIKSLDISNNQLTRLSNEAINFLSSVEKLDAINLSGNPWLCDCPSFNLALFLRGGFKQVKDVHKVQCQDGKPVEELEERNICKEDVEVSTPGGFGGQGEAEKGKQGGPGQNRRKFGQN